MKKTVYVDLDGVVADFVSHYSYLYGDISNSDELHENKKLFAKDKFFLNLPVINKGIELLRWLDSLDNTKVDVRILTAVGDNNLTENKSFKKQWVVENLGNYPFYWVKKAAQKSKFATDNSYLIDDRSKSLNPFIDAGGHGFLFDSDSDSNELVKKSILEFLNK